MIAAVLGIAAGIAFIALIAIVVGIMDAVNAPAWRSVAAERRERWEEARRPEFHGPPRDLDAWDED